MAIPIVYGAPSALAVVPSAMSVVPSALAVVPSAMSVVPSGQADASTQQELIERQRGDISFYKNVAIGGVVVAVGAVGFTLFQQYMQRQRVTLARAEGATLGYVPESPRGRRVPPPGYGPQGYGPQGYGPQGYPPSYY